MADDLLEPAGEGFSEPDLDEETPGEDGERHGSADADGIVGAEHLGLTPPD